MKQRLRSILNHIRMLLIYWLLDLCFRLAPHDREGDALMIAMAEMLSALDKNGVGL